MSTHRAPAGPKPTGKSVLTTVLIAAVVAIVVLLVGVLPAEYGVDPTGVGRMLGLTAMKEEPVGRTIEIKDVIGGNETLRQVAIPDPGEPTPLPNPRVYQHQDKAPETRTVTITLQPLKGAEVKTKLQELKVVAFEWKTDRGSVYCDYHGHDPDAGGKDFVRYREDQEAATGYGSLVAPFKGEHGWYWLNYNNFPVTITLTVTGYFDDIVTYGNIG